MLVQRSFQPPPLPTVRVVGGHVVLALARHVEARLLQGGDDAGPVLHRAALDAPQQVVPDLVPGIGLMRDPCPQLRRLEVGAVPRLLIPGARRIVRAAPALVEVAGLDQGVVGLLPARRRDVEALARLPTGRGGKWCWATACVVSLLEWGIIPSRSLRGPLLTPGAYPQANRLTPLAAQTGKAGRMSSAVGPSSASAYPLPLPFRPCSAGAPSAARPAP